MRLFCRSAIRVRMVERNRFQTFAARLLPGLDRRKSAEVRSGLRARTVVNGRTRDILLTMEVRKRHARAGAIISDTVSPATPPRPAGGTRFRALSTDRCDASWTFGGRRASESSSKQQTEPARVQRQRPSRFGVVTKVCRVDRFRQAARRPQTGDVRRLAPAGFSRGAAAAFARPSPRPW